MAILRTGHLLQRRSMPVSANKVPISRQWRSAVLCLSAVGGLLMTVALVLPARAAPRVILTGHTLPLGGLAYSADGLYIATGSYDRTAKVWDAATRKELVTLKGPGR